MHKNLKSTLVGKLTYCLANTCHAKVNMAFLIENEKFLFRLAYNCTELYSLLSVLTM